MFCWRASATSFFRHQRDDHGRLFSCLHDRGRAFLRSIYRFRAFHENQGNFRSVKPLYKPTGNQNSVQPTAIMRKNSLKNGAWTLYMLRNERNALYTGITSDLERRFHEHTSGHSKCAKFTRSCKSLKLVYRCEIGSKSQCLTVEALIKRLKKDQKEIIVRSGFDKNELLEFLSRQNMKGPS